VLASRAHQWNTPTGRRTPLCRNAANRASATIAIVLTSCPSPACVGRAEQVVALDLGERRVCFEAVAREFGEEVVGGETVVLRVVIAAHTRLGRVRPLRSESERVLP
jgi:hypothetical protein